MRTAHRSHRSTPPRSAFAGFRFPADVIVLAVRWYLRFGLSYRDVEELLTERGVEVDHVTIPRWVLRFTPLLADAARPCRHAVGSRWQVDETYVKVAGRWRHVYPRDRPVRAGHRPLRRTAPRPRPTRHRCPAAQAADAAGCAGGLRPAGSRWAPRRQAGRAGPQHILAVHRCLHRALAQAVTWRLLARNVATDTTPPPVPRTEVVALAPEQVALLLDAADRAPSLWLGSWTVLAVATGARNGELCGLEWADLDLDAGTVRFHQALTIIHPAVLPDDADSGGRRKELALGPVKSTASRAILTLPPFAIQALRHHRRQQARLRLACGQPQTVTLRRVEPGRPPQPVQLDLVFRTERGTPVNPNHASRAFARLAASVGLAAHPHMLRHALASAMAAEKEPASIIAAQLRHADGGALAQRVYIHQLPQTAPRLAGMIEGVFGPAARDGRAVSAARRVEGNRSETRPSNPA